MSDLDGTLLQPDSRLSDRTVGMLNRAIAEGKMFTIATARTPATVAAILDGVDMRLPAVVMTGAALWNPATGHYSRREYLDSEAVKRLLGIYKDTDTSSFVFTLNGDMIDIYHVGGALNELQQQFIDERSHSPYKRFHVTADGGDVLPPDMSKVILLYSMLPDAKAASTYELTKRIKRLRAQYYHDIFGPEIGILEAFSDRATKADAVKALADQAGAGRIVCFGDNINDLSMMEVADVAVAVENALPEVKEAADIVIGPNTDDSVARFILEDRP